MTQSPSRSRLNRRQALGAVGAAAAGFSFPFVHAQSGWRPSGTVKLIVPWPAGGPTDILARLISTGLTEMGLPSIVENKPGATGTLGAEYVYRSNPDGLNLLVATSDTISIFPQLSKTRFEADRFVPIAGMGGIPLYLVGRPDLPARNLTELATLARKQNMSYANAGTGGALHMAAVAFGKAVNAVEMMHVPFQGAVPAMQSILGKQVDLCMTTGSLALQQRGRVIIFGGSGAKRLAGLADAPTFIEQGLPLEIVSWSGLLAAPETRPELAADIAKTMGEIIASAPYQTKLAELMMSSYAMSHPEFAKFLTGEHRKWADLVRASNVKLD